MINTAISSGLSAEISFDKSFINKFQNMYHSFLKEKKADQRYYLNNDFITGSPGLVPKSSYFENLYKHHFTNINIPKLMI